ncbi:hypothetical protein RQP54_06160 [Curvibacter sp. APW13]|uniref:hypothetical protein n=1 Tax=Curvibacter sp. APW13 TaxID=3077236 RepID=UPI0028DEEDB0|nr:hypothetical protein [Curvibacter sp. APW13]MDT8990447.1 hypothetical protein [Curvibacter sp. APW13]
MCANMEPGAKCPLDGEMLCRNERPSSAGASTLACTPRTAAPNQPQPVQWEPPRSAATPPASGPQQH